jgi:hypothetical protein
LVANGQVSSETYSSQGPATVYALSSSAFRAAKRVIVDPYGIQEEDARAIARSATQLSGIRTEMDPIPLLGDFTQAVVRNRYFNQADIAQWETENKITSRVSSRMDQEVSKQVDAARERFAQRFLQPMRDLGLNPVALDMRTSREQLVARCRLAGHHHLAAFTPRPRAPEGSLFSMQLHESAVNNLVDQLGWAGKRVNLLELYQQTAALLGFGQWTPPDDFPDDVMVQFADQQPVKVTLRDGSLALRLALVELSQGRRRWNDFTVRVHYRPANPEEHADLVRDRYVGLAGRRLSFRDQIALRGVFSKVFSLAKPVRFITERLESDERLEGLGITQMVIHDGWLGVAVGEPEAVAARSPDTSR